MPSFELHASQYRYQGSFFFFYIKVKDNLGVTTGAEGESHK